MTARVRFVVVPQLVPSCHCLCGLHMRMDPTWHCDVDVRWVLTLTGGLASPTDVPMCGPCGQWWRTTHPGRVESAVATIPRAR